MTTPVWTELVCRTCSQASVGQFTLSGRVAVTALRNAAKERGWVFTHNECFCSKACLDKYREQEKGIR